jgi:SAM-dependent methyltransferase
MAFWLFQSIPGFSRLHYFAQRRITKTLPRAPEHFAAYLREVECRRDRFLRYGTLTGKIMLEFGAGWDLFHNIALYCYGLDKQILVDLSPHMRPELVDGNIVGMMRNPPAGAVRHPVLRLGPDPFETLRNTYGIDYRAPADARTLDLADNAIDFVATTNTLEHIPFGSLAEIMRECRRVCKPDGMICMQIDYSDHYSHSDCRITPYNFLKFSRSEWRFYNPPNHYQNRRRHSDYRKLFIDTGYEVVDEDAIYPEGWKEMLASVTRHPDFSAYNEDDLGITSGCFVLRPAKSPE